MSFEITLTKKSVDRTQKKFAKLRLNANKIIARALEDEINDKVYAKSQRLTPFGDGVGKGGTPGELRESGKVSPVSITPFSVSITIGYYAEYARKLHEVQYANYTTEGTGSKYLETPFREWADSARTSLSRKIAREIKRLVS